MLKLPLSWNTRKVRAVSTNFFSIAALLCVAGQMPGEDTNLSEQLIAIHNKWFKAFDNHDSETMNKIEMKNITLVMPDGQIIRDFAPRKKVETQLHPEIKRTVSNASVRQFGDSALLVCIVTTDSPQEKGRSAETVSFVKVEGEWKIASAQWTDLVKPK